MRPLTGHKVMSIRNELASMWDYDHKKDRMDKGDEDMAMVDDEVEADIDLDREFKTAEEYVDEYDDGI